MTSLTDYGWNQTRQDYLVATLPDTDLLPARVVADYGTVFTLASPQRISAQLSGSALHSLPTTEQPKVGDWVMVDTADADQSVIHSVLPRFSQLVRGQVGRIVDKQIVAANIDIALIVQPLDNDFNVARLERYIFQLSSQSIQPVILLNKVDQIKKDLSVYLSALDGIGADIITISALHDTDVTTVRRYITAGKTAVILGSSGAGKSTLTNRLIGEQRQKTQEIRARDGKGRHTTVHRELFVLPGGGMIIDTPGIRELQLWGTAEDLEATFPEIAQASSLCHYPNCSHDSEDRCGIKSGLADGTISPERYKIYQNFSDELQALDARRGFITKRRSEQSRQTAKRLRRRQERDSFGFDQRDDT